MFDTIWQDLTYAARSLRRTPAFTAAAIVTLALGIGANSALFTLFDVVMLRPLPVAKPGELFAVRETDPAYNGAEPTGLRLRRFSFPRFLDLQAAMPAGGVLAAMTPVTRQLTVRTGADGQARVAPGQFVSGRFFDTFQVRAARGRLLSDDDNRAGADAVVVVSDGWWQRELGGEADVVGRQLVVNGTPATIVGVAQPGFSGAWADDPASVWFPIAMQQALRYRGAASNYGADVSAAWMAEDRIAWLTVAGRAPGGASQALQQRLAAANRLGLQRYADGVDAEEERRALLAHELVVDPLSGGFSTVRDQYTNALFLLAAMVGLVLLVACVNVANLLLARAAARQGEIGLRVSLGATRARLVRQCLTESVVLAALGGAGGLILGQWGTRLLAVIVPLSIGETLQASAWPDLRVLAFVVGASLVTSLLFGLLPALRTSRLDLHGVRVGSRAFATSAGMRPLVALQLGLCFVVVVSAALLGRSLLNLARFDPGFDRQHLVSIAVEPVISGYPRSEMPSLHRRVIAAVEGVAGVRSASVSMLALAAGGQAITNYRLEGYTPSARETMEFHTNRVGPRYFETVGMALAEGRDFVDGDGLSRPVAIINETLARRYFKDRSPIGLHLGEDEAEAEIVGVVRDARVQGLRTTPLPTIYFPLDQNRTAARSIDVRAAGDPATIVAALQSALRRAEPRLHVDRIRTVDEQLELNAQRDIQLAYVSSAFGLLALALACVGLYGVLSYAVSRRTREVGVRMAVGASPLDVLLLVLREGGRICAAGLIGGVIAALGAHRLIAGLLFDVSATDPVTYAAVAAVLAMVTAAACFFPARRAAGVEPSAALRAE